MYEPTSRVSVKAAQLADQIRDLAAVFFQKNLPGEVVTVVRTTISPDFHNATLWIRTFPAEKSISIVSKIERQYLGSLQKSLRQQFARKVLPRLHVAIDQGPEMEDSLTALLR